MEGRDEGIQAHLVRSGMFRAVGAGSPIVPLRPTEHAAPRRGTAREVADISRDLLPYGQFCDVWVHGPGAGPDDVVGIIEEAIDQRMMCGAGCLARRGSPSPPETRRTLSDPPDPSFGEGLVRSGAALNPSSGV